MGRYSDLRESSSTSSSKNNQQQQHSYSTTPNHNNPKSHSSHTLSYSCVTKSTTVRTLRKMSCLDGVGGGGSGGYGNSNSSDSEDDYSSSAGFSSRTALAAKSTKAKAYSTNSLPRGVLSGGVRCGNGNCSTNGSSGGSLGVPSIFDTASPEEIAFQLTLIDSELFRAIQIEELISCGWTRKEKETLAPHVLAFTRRFNHLSFWVVEEILNGPSPKDRALLISTFIRLCSKLAGLNNLHSLFATVSALQSASIFRLSKSWELVSRKDRTTVQKYVELFSDQDNWAKLRERLDSLRLPCVPYIGVYLTDLVYLSLTHRCKNGSVGLSLGNGTDRLDENYGANNIFRIVTTYQSGSSYSHLPRDYNLQVKLRSVRYIDELLKFVEDYNYKRSLSLEPPPEFPQNGPLQSPNQPTQKDKSPQQSPTQIQEKSSTSNTPTTKKFIPGHKKSHSWMARIPWINKNKAL